MVTQRIMVIITLLIISKRRIIAPSLGDYQESDNDHYSLRYHTSKRYGRNLGSGRSCGVRDDAKYPRCKKIYRSGRNAIYRHANANYTAHRGDVCHSAFRRGICAGLEYITATAGDDCGRCFCLPGRQLDNKDGGIQGAMRNSK